MNKVSRETQEQAIKVAKGTQRKNQTKEQTKLIAQGIEKGIAEYKKQQNVKARERDKIRKAKLKASAEKPDIIEDIDEPSNNKLPWFLLLISWVGFAVWAYLYA